ncbi:MAG: WxL domain-containing protein [Clostridioides sp.]|jgi:hypothetical protein|nr:WxL domain-containing protein [Clostridioides sp.]
MKFSKLKKFATIAIVSGFIITTGNALVVSADTATSNGTATFIENTDPGTAIDPTDPDKPITGSEDTTTNIGNLKIVVRPTLEFGNTVISASNKIYWANALKVDDNHHSGTWEPRYAQVADDRGTFEGWQMTVTQKKQFTSPSNKVLEGAKITFNNGEKATTATGANNSGVTVNKTIDIVNIGPTFKYEVMDAKLNSGSGNFVARYGNEETQYLNSVTKENHHNISLLVIGGTASKEKYTTDMEWNLENTPK